MKTVDLATKPGLRRGAKGALVSLTAGAAMSTVAACVMSDRHVDIPSVIIAALLLGGAGYGISRIGAEVSDSAPESAQPAEDDAAEARDEEPEHAAESAS